MSTSYRELNKTTPLVRQNIKAVAKVDDNTWYYVHLAIASLSVVLCLGIILVGGTMILLLNLEPLQGVASFSIVSLFDSVGRPYANPV